MNKPCNNEESYMQGQGSVCSTRQCQACLFTLWQTLSCMHWPSQPSALSPNLNDYVMSWSSSSQPDKYAFSMMFSAILTDAFHCSDIGICLRYQFDRNMQGLQAKSKVQNGVIPNFLFADGSALNAPSLKCRKAWICFYSLSLTSSTKKTEITYQPTPAAPYTELTITVGSQKFAVTDKYTYLASFLSRTFNIDKEVTYRIACINMALSS